MALINCFECAREISDRAAACPHCGRPMLPALAPSTPGRSLSRGTLTIQATSKLYKALQLIGAASITLAVVSCAVGAPSSGKWSAFVFLLGAALYTFGRVGAWWNHG